ncbi:cellulase family glycosylhydrolase [Spirosoma foliorum]|uniref:mannan endo-1,4-beta-mannosidase n=1 Tax=Spirosoma foliorum TaxID=2710596 RepID=A0A7G5H0E4_9BACT|nr:cellulase family glycosylhydrolase [Spirosoma foliorum]QMW04586.1 cellulase family glycosylhydrolase [Spirosoma foliorum]
MPFLFLLIVQIIYSCNSFAQQVGDSSVVISHNNPFYFEKNKKLFIPIGINLCWPETNDNSEFKSMEDYFQKLSANKGNYVRIWLSTPFWEIEKKTPGSYDESKIDRLKKLLLLAHKYNIYIMFCLHHFRNISLTQRSFYNKVNYSSLFSNINEYFSLDTGKELYIKRASLILNTFSYDSNIIAWELWNEIDTVDGTVWEDWTAYMLQYFSNNFPKLLFTQSLGSYDDARKENTYKNILSLNHNKISQVHRYLDSGARWPVVRSCFMDSVCGQAIFNIRSYHINKPVLLSETGAVEKSHTGPWKYYLKDTLGILLHDILFAPYFSGAAGPGHSWHWDQYINKLNLWWHFKRFNNVIQVFDPIKENAQPYSFTVSDSLAFYGLKGKNNEIFWIRDHASNWKSEIVDNLPARIIHNRIVDLPSKDIKLVQAYDPWTDKWTNISIRDNKIILPDFRRSLVLKLSKYE